MLHCTRWTSSFVSLRENGQGDEKIAAAFFVTLQVVQQRLKLASVAPALIEVYAEDGITLEQLMAFTGNQDHNRHAQVWDLINSSWNKEPYQIRRMLTETAVRALDRRAVFVGVDAYQAARGSMLHDMFQGDDTGWLEDPALLDRLVTERLQAEVIAVDGWKWIEVSLDLPYGYSHGLRRLSGDPAPMTDDECAAHAPLLAEYRALEEEYAGQDEFPEEIDTRLGELEQAMEKLEVRPLVFDQTEVMRAGAFVTLDRSGELAVYRGYDRPEDEPRIETAVQDGVDPALAGQGVGLADDEDDGMLKPLPQRLVTELTAHRTLALREAVGRSPDVALTRLFMKLITDTFQSTGASGICLEASVREVYMSAQDADLKASPVAQAVAERHVA